MPKTDQTKSHLEGLQEIDQRIEGAQQKLRSFEPLLEEVESAALDLESEVTTTRARLQEMKVEERRVELSAQEKRLRAKKLEERLNQVRNVREEAAVSAELDMVRRAIEGDEQEAFTLLDQIRKLEERLDEQEQAVAVERAQVEPRQTELRGEQERATAELEELRAQRDRFTDSMPESELRVYESIRGRGNRRAVALLTPDGACGNCFNMVPLQLCNEIKHGAAMIRCEACGVILAAVEDGEKEVDQA